MLCMQLLTYGRRIPHLELFARISAVHASTNKRLANHFIYDQNVAIAAMDPIKKLPDYNWFQGFNQGRSLVLKAQAQKAVESMNSSPKSSTKPETPLSTGDNAEGVEKSAGQAAVSESTISAFMAEVADLVKLVDSRDITELQLKQNDCELIIRKKEALPQPPPSPYLMMQPPPQASIPSQPPLPQSPPGPTPSALAPALPPPAKTSSSSLPSLKCPMAGNFYRSPAPGEPPFVKVGDKVKKGQVVCIIEAMKLMNEIEADQSGTIVEIIAEDGKPISVDMPLLVIQP